MLTTVPRFVDRDMVMHYHWGLVVGHVYTHVVGSDLPQMATTNSSTTVNWDNNELRSKDLSSSASFLKYDNDVGDCDNPELSFENSKDELFSW